jgi:hypothetical protein
VNRYDLIVGEQAHRAVAAIARLGRRAGMPALEEAAWEVAGELMAKHRDLGLRARAGRLVVGSAAAVYARVFLPPASWTLRDAEVDIEGGRLDLVWDTDDARVVYDEVKLVGSLDRPRGEGRTSRQVRAYLAHGNITHGDAFGGVRLVLLGAPRHSMLIGPGERRARLVDTPLWFAELGEDRA